jgi:hypothetical protein
MDINWMLGELLKDQAIKTISKKTGLDEDNAKSLAWKALPLLLWALKKNASDPEKKVWLEKAIEKHTWEVLSNPDKIDLTEWSKILTHVFWNSKKEVEQKVWDKSVLEVLAPMVMWALWEANTKTWKSASDLLSDNWVIMWLAKSFLDKDNDWSIMDDLFWMAMNFMKK